jgi:LuxR family transcriptional regulator, quorum-sensing system regulator BjaR1
MVSQSHSYFQQAMSAIELIESATSKHQLADIVQFSIYNLGFPTVAAMRLPSANEALQECLYVNTRQDDFIGEYFEAELAKCDPVFDILYDARHPYRWSHAQRVSKMINRKRVSDLAESYDMLDGYVLHVSQMGGIGLLSVSIGREEPAADAYRALHLIGTYCLSKFQTLEREQLPMIKLHRREQECLQWIALGKTDQEIAAIIGLSPNTVRMYVEQAKDKLGTSNRTAAVVQAIRRSVICI